MLRENLHMFVQFHEDMECGRIGHDNDGDDNDVCANEETVLIESSRSFYWKLYETEGRQR